MKNAVKMSFLSKIKGPRIWRELVLILLEADPGRIMKRLQELDLLRFIYPSLTFYHEKEKLFGEMDTVLKWYNLLYKGKYNRVFYYLLGLTDHMSPDEVGDLSRRLVASESTRKKLPQEVANVREVSRRLSAAIRFMKK